MFEIPPTSLSSFIDGTLVESLQLLFILNVHFKILNFAMKYLHLSPVRRP